MANKFLSSSSWWIPLYLCYLVANLVSMRSAVAFRSQAFFGAATRRPKCLLQGPQSYWQATDNSKKSTVFTMMTAPYSSTLSRHTPVPRAAVSVVVRHHDPKAPQSEPQFLLIERGNPPNAGVWCVPGGKIEMGETTLNAAQRELKEEVKFVEDDATKAEADLAWYSGAFCTSDSIVQGDPETGKTGYHYVIAQCFAEILMKEQKSTAEPPKVTPSDDAKGAKWWTLQEIKTAEANKETVPNLAMVIERAESLYAKGMLPTTAAAAAAANNNILNASK